MTTRTLISTSEGTHRDAFVSKDWALLVFTGVTWGASFLFIAIGVEAFAPTQVGFLRIFFAFLTLSFAKKAKSRIERDDWPTIFGLAFTWMAFPFLLFPIAEQHVSSSLAGMLNGAVPIFVAIIATMLLRRAPGRQQRRGLALGIGGLILVGLPALGGGSNSIFGVALILLAVLSYGVAMNVSVPIVQKYGPLPVLWRALGVATLMSAPGAAWGLGSSHFEFISLLAVIALGIAGTALAPIAFTTLGARVGSTRASVAVYISPPMALLLGVALRDEPLELLSVVGTVVILGGAWLTSRADPV